MNWQDREDERRRRILRAHEAETYGRADRDEDRDYVFDADGHRDYRAERDLRRREDFGQADYSTDYAYDIDSGRAYRRNAEADRDYGRRMDEGHYRPTQPRSWLDRAADVFSGHDRDERPERVETRPRRRGPSDRVLWAVIVERLEDERGLDLRDVDVIVEDQEVTLNGTVRRKAEKRRIEDVADVDGIRHVQNNLRVRDRPHWTFL